MTERDERYMAGGGLINAENLGLVPVVKHATVSGHVFRLEGGVLMVGLIYHPRFSHWHPPGGHVEGDETPEWAVYREVLEETGLRGLRMVCPRGPMIPPLPMEPHRPLLVARPWWVVEEQVGPDNHLKHPHFHIDHHYLLMVRTPDVAHPGEHPFRWFTQEEVLSLDMYYDFRELTLAMFRLHELEWASNDQ